MIIIILGEQYEIKKVETELNANWVGSCSPSKCEIKVGDNAPVPFWTCLHEIVHGYLGVSGCPIPGDHEELCNLVASIIESLVRQNGLSIFTKLHSLFYDKKDKKK